MDKMEVDKTLILVTNDGKEIETRFEIVEQSAFLKETVESGEADDSGKIVIPLTVESSVMAHVIEFCEYHVDNEFQGIFDALKSPDLTKIATDWDVEYLNNRDDDLLVKIISAANYLDIHDLLMLCCAKFAADLKKLTYDEIYEKFGLDKDLEITDDQRQEVINCNKSFRDKMKKRREAQEDKKKQKQTEEQVTQEGTK